MKHRCPDCDEPVEAQHEFCPGCGADLFYDPDQEPDSTGGLIPYKNSPALIAYYLGVFSVIPLFPIGLAALVFGIYGVKRYKANPVVKGIVHAWVGIILGGIFGLGWLVGTAWLIT